MGDIFPWLGCCWCHKHNSRDERLERWEAAAAGSNVHDGHEDEKSEESRDGLADREKDRFSNLRNAIIILD